MRGPEVFGDAEAEAEAEAAVVERDAAAAGVADGAGWGVLEVAPQPSRPVTAASKPAALLTGSRRVTPSP